MYIKCIFLFAPLPRGGWGKSDYKPKQKKGEDKGGKGKKGKKKKEKGKKGKEKERESGKGWKYEKRRKKMVFGSHRIISKTFLGKKIKFFPFPRRKECI